MLETAQNGAYLSLIFAMFPKGQLISEQIMVFEIYKKCNEIIARISALGLKWVTLKE